MYVAEQRQTTCTAALEAFDVTKAYGTGGAAVNVCGTAYERRQGAAPLDAAHRL